jgi:hypothetical protein
MSFISFLNKLDQDAKGTLGVDEGNQILVSVQIGLFIDQFYPISL